ncbi:MAG: hypothetical protein J0L73_28355 [Verrucomicrobia bacterium]|nr:hypothetical protein [Verrucomicrobiota bacterium]
MSAWSLSNEEQARERFWRTPVPDPTRTSKRAGVAHFAKRNTLRALMPSDFIPIGEHQGKHLHAVPHDYLLWVNAQPWSKTWPQWQPIADYIDRNLLDASDSDRIEHYREDSTPIFFVDALRQYPTKLRCFQAGSSHLHCLPGHEDRLHAFAVGCLRLSRDYYQGGKLPHYDLTVGKHAQALQHRYVELITDKQLIQHKDQWLEFFRTKPSLPQ